MIVTSHGRRYQNLGWCPECRMTRLLAITGCECCYLPTHQYSVRCINGCLRHEARADVHLRLVAAAIAEGDDETGKEGSVQYWSCSQCGRTYPTAMILWLPDGSQAHPALTEADEPVRLCPRCVQRNAEDQTRECSKEEHQ